MSKKNIILGLFLILLSFVFILYFVYFHDKSFKANNLNQKVNTNNLNQKVNTNNIMECVIDDETGVNLLSALDFTGAYSYYDNQINISKNLDDKILYEIKKAYGIFSEGEILNKQEEYFKKGKIILDDIKNEKKYNCGEYYRVYAFGYEMTRDYKNAINMYQKALSLFEKAGEKTYKSFIVSILGSLGHTYMLLGNPYEAQKYLMMGYGLDKNNIFINSLLFRNFGTLGFKDESIKFGEKLVNELYPKEKNYNKQDLGEIYFGLANMYLFSGDVKKGLEYSQKCLQQDETYALCYVANARAYFYGIKDNKGIPFAKFGINKAIKYDKTNSYAYDLLSKIEEAEGNIEKAIEIYKDNYDNIIDKDTNLFDDSRLINKEMTLINIVRLYSKKGDIEEAYEYLQKLLQKPIGFSSLGFLEREILKDNSDLDNLIKDKDLSEFNKLWNVYKNIKCQKLYNDKWCDKLLKIQNFLSELEKKGKEQVCSNDKNLINSEKAICKLIGFKK